MSDVVSSFELIFKPQSPEPVNDGEPVATVLQGYFLSISNLTDEAYRYSLRFRIAEPGDPTRSLTDNTVVIIDVPDENNTFTRLRSFDGESFFIDSGSIRIPGHGTALVAVLPQVFGPVPGDPTPIPSPNFEVRGASSHIKCAIEWVGEARRGFGKPRVTTHHGSGPMPCLFDTIRDTSPNANV
jgi:hypothetical protein